MKRKRGGVELRKKCEVVGCRCSVKVKLEEGQTIEVLCPKHYRLVSQHLKRRRRRLKTLIGKAERAGRLSVMIHLISKDEELWQKAKTQAMERAAGIS